MARNHAANGGESRIGLFTRTSVVTGTSRPSRRVLWRSAMHALGCERLEDKLLLDCEGITPQYRITESVIDRPQAVYAADLKC
jgi:hypothetical protein